MSYLSILSTKVMNVPSYVKLPEGKYRINHPGYTDLCGPLYCLEENGSPRSWIVIINQPGLFNEYIPISLMVKPP